MGFRELDQDAPGCLGMEKCDAVAAGAGPGLVVHQAVAGPSAGGERDLEVGNPVADVVDAGTAALEEPGNRTAGFGVGQELDAALAEWQGDDGRPVGLLGRFGREAENISIECERGRQIGNRDAHVGDTWLGH